MASMLDQLPEIISLGGDELMYLVLNGKDYSFRAKNLSSLVGIPTKEQIGLGNVDNTSDANKPISIAVAQALLGKAAVSHTHTKSEISGLVDDLTTINASIAGLNASMNVLQTEFLNVSSIATAASNAVSSMSGTVDTLVSQFSAMTAQVATLNTNVTSANGRITTLSTTVQTLSNQQAEMSSTLSAANINIANLQSNQSALTLEFQGVKSEVNSLSTTVLNAVTQVQQVAQGFNAMAERVSTLEGRADVTDNSIALLETNVRQNTDNITYLLDKVAQDIVTTVTFDQNSDW